jgi:triphosphatase
LAQGIEELKALAFLHDAVIECEVEDPGEFKQWMSDKTQNLIQVMERTREIAMHAEVYW